MAEPTLAKVPVSTKIDRVLAREVELLLRGSNESLSQFVAGSILNECHRRLGTRPPRELTLADVDRRLDVLASEVEKVGYQARLAAEMLAGVCQAVGVDLPQAMRALGKAPGG